MIWLVLENFVSSGTWDHPPVVVLLEILRSCFCRCHDWRVFCVGSWRYCFLGYMRKPTWCYVVGDFAQLFVPLSWLVCCLCCVLWGHLPVVVLMVVSHSCLRLRHVCMSWAGPVLVISAPGPRAPCNIFNPTRYTRLGIKCSSGLNSYARMPDNQQLKPLWRTAYYPHYRFIILLPTYYQSDCNGVISVGSDICLWFHCCS